MDAHSKHDRVRRATKHRPGSIEEPLEQKTMPMVLMQLDVLRGYANACDILFSHSFDLSDVVLLADAVHQRELVVQEPKKLAGRHRACESVEVGDDDKQYRHTIHMIGDVRLGISKQRLDHMPRHHVPQYVEQGAAVLALLLILYEACPFNHLVLAPAHGPHNEGYTQQARRICDLTRRVNDLMHEIAVQHGQWCPNTGDPEPHGMHVRHPDCAPREYEDQRHEQLHRELTLERTIATVILFGEARGQMKRCLANFLQSPT
mmetsp:Transcript_79028/g.228464  ORF Transcript_79028/g.228464 Transcript_79028/m.228464 type:complete len:261 (+) Transcript_79028:1976-2758(+)